MLQFSSGAPYQVCADWWRTSLTFEHNLLLAIHYTHINTYYVLLLLFTVPMLSTTKYQNILYLAAITTDVWSATASFEDLVALHTRTLQEIF